jgi:hypothetical protein
LDLVDWCVANRVRRTPYLVIDQDRIDWLEKRLRWNVIGILRDPSVVTSLTEKLYLQDRQWYPIANFLATHMPSSVKITTRAVRLGDDRVEQRREGHDDRAITGLVTRMQNI